MGHFWKGRYFEDKCMEFYSTFERQVGFLLWGTLGIAEGCRKFGVATVCSVGNTPVTGQYVLSTESTSRPTVQVSTFCME